LNTQPFFFYHIGHEIYYTNLTDIYTYVSCEFPESELCAKLFVPPATFKDHSKYMALSPADYLNC